MKLTDAEACHPGLNKEIFFEDWAKDKAGLWWPVGMSANVLDDKTEVGGLYVARADWTNRGKSSDIYIISALGYEVGLIVCVVT